MGVGICFQSCFRVWESVFFTHFEVSKFEFGKNNKRKYVYVFSKVRFALGCFSAPFFIHFMCAFDSFLGNKISTPPPPSRCANVHVPSLLSLRMVCFLKIMTDSKMSNVRAQLPIVKTARELDRNNFGGKCVNSVGVGYYWICWYEKFVWCTSRLKHFPCP